MAEVRSRIRMWGWIAGAGGVVVVVVWAVSRLWPSGVVPISELHSAVWWGQARCRGVVSLGVRQEISSGGGGQTAKEPRLWFVLQEDESEVLVVARGETARMLWQRREELLPEAGDRVTASGRLETCTVGALLHRCLVLGSHESLEIEHAGSGMTAQHPRGPGGDAVGGDASPGAPDGDGSIPDSVGSFDSALDEMDVLATGDLPGEWAYLESFPLVDALTVPLPYKLDSSDAREGVTEATGLQGDRESAYEVVNEVLVDAPSTTGQVTRGKRVETAKDIARALVNLGEVSSVPPGYHVQVSGVLRTVPTHRRRGFWVLHLEDHLGDRLAVAVHPSVVASTPGLWWVPRGTQVQVTGRVKVVRKKKELLVTGVGGNALKGVPILEEHGQMDPGDISRDHKNGLVRVRGRTQGCGVDRGSIKCTLSGSRGAVSVIVPRRVASGLKPPLGDDLNVEVRGRVWMHHGAPAVQVALLPHVRILSGKPAH